MNYVDYIQLNSFQKMAYQLKRFFIAIPKSVAHFFVFLGQKIASLVMGIGKGFKNYVLNFIHGDWSTKTSYLVMGSGCIAKGQIIKGILFFILEVLYILFMTCFAWQYISKFGTLGTVATTHGMDAMGMPKDVYGDNSMFILLYGVLTIVVTCIFFAVYIANIKQSIALEAIKKVGKKPNNFLQDLKELLDKRYH